MLVREAEAHDLNLIVKFQMEMAKETEGIELNQNIVEQGVAAVLADSAKGRYYVAEAENSIIGSLLTTYEWSDWRNGTVLWIQSVFVTPEYRRKGVYTQLYQYIRTIVLSDNNFKGIRLYADKSNIVAHKVYQKLGMTPDHYLTFEWLK